MPCRAGAQSCGGDASTVAAGEAESTTVAAAIRESVHTASTTHGFNTTTTTLAARTANVAVMNSMATSIAISTAIAVCKTNVGAVTMTWGTGVSVVDAIFYGLITDTAIAPTLTATIILATAIAILLHSSS